MLEELAKSVSSHTGQFHCVQIGNETNKKVATFRHCYTAPSDTSVPPVPGLQEFYSTFGSLILYQEPETQEAAFHIASPSEWSEFDEYFRPWLNDLDEVSDLVPPWIDDCATVGEIPGSGNYLLIPLSGPESGKVFEFEHDGFEFIARADSLPDFVGRQLDLDTAQLTAMASHLRFVGDPPNAQWWIEELTDNRGNKVRTEA